LGSAVRRVREDTCMYVCKERERGGFPSANDVG
jgi:hypothetical protein